MGPCSCRFHADTVTTSIFSLRQAQGIEQINQGLSQIDQVTQANAEQSAAAEEELAAQAQELRQLVAQFKLAGGQQAEVLGSNGNGNGSRAIGDDRKEAEQGGTLTAVGVETAVPGRDPGQVIRLDNDDAFGAS